MEMLDETQERAQKPHKEEESESRNEKNEESQNPHLTEVTGELNPQEQELLEQEAACEEEEDEYTKTNEE